MTILADSWSVGVLVGLPLAIVLLLVGIGCIVLFATQCDDYDRPIFVGGAVLFTLAVIVIAGWDFYPYNGQYHKWETTSGKVAEISSRFLGNDKSTTQRFVVRFSSGEERSCDDTRCALVKKGDLLELTCKRHWQFAGRTGGTATTWGGEHDLHHRV